MDCRVKYFILCLLLCLFFKLTLPVEEIYFASQNESQLWRLFTAHWAHWDWHHLIMNVLGLLLVLRIQTQKLHHLILSTILTISAVSVYLLAFLDGNYAGFSAICFSILGLNLAKRAEKNWRKSLTQCSLVMVYIFFQCIDMNSAREITPLAESHLIGFLIGLSVCYLTRFTFTPRPKPST